MSDFLKSGKELVSLVKYAFGGGEYPVVNDYENTFKLALKHSVINLYYFAVKDCSDVPSDIKKAAEKYYLANTRQQISQSYYADKIFESLKENGVKYMPLKGYFIRDMYPRAEMRTSCDLDFLYEQKSTDKVRHIITELGFSEEKSCSNHLTFVSHPVTVEAHFTLSSRANYETADKLDKYFDDFFDKAKPYNETEFRFNEIDFYLYYTLHSFKHFVGGGFGIRTVLDYYVLGKNYVGDKSELYEKLSEFGLEKFVKEIESLADYWFGSGQKTKSTEYLEEFVLKSGTYGTALNQAAVVGTAKRGNTKTAKTRFYLSKIFPPYKNMCVTYKWLSKAPILLPIAYVMRIFTTIFKRSKNIKNVYEIANGMTDNDIILAKKVKEITEIR